MCIVRGLDGALLVALALTRGLLLRMQGLGKLNLVFDIEKLRTECHVFARHIISVIYVIQVNCVLASVDICHAACAAFYFGRH